MKRIHEFEKENHQLDDNILSQIMGGETTLSSRKYKGTDGCMHTYTDEFEDCNGDGIWNQGTEQGTSCEEIEC
ncbi:hypothetical protein [Kordia jejudonensis]|uniref:hypothetical protein n=1 Tax=Kordia jejudonensis TaxID=1348245 RepID=UPI0006297300|nr:hypothetical protein [Kordia jejudonensis]